MNLSFKPGVQLAGVQPQTVAGIHVAWSIYQAHGLPCCVTSVMDVAPGRVHNTLHAAGLAWDLRIPSRYGAAVTTDDQVRTELASALGGEFQVILHGEDMNRHYHCQWKPKEQA